MNFLAIIIALVLAQATGAAFAVQRDDWFARWQARVEAWTAGAVAQLALSVLAPVALAQLLLHALQPVLFGLPWIALAVVLLLYALGRGDFHQLMARYRGQCRTADFEGAYLSTLEEPGDSGNGNGPGTPREVHARVQQGVFYEGYQRWFPVVFYFALLGPAGALAYRLLQLCRDTTAPRVTGRCLFLADWLPARLLAATFTLTGNFVGGGAVLGKTLAEGAAPAARLLYDVGTAALASPAAPAPDAPSFGEYAAGQNADTETLLSRSAICWVVLLSLVVLLG